MPKEIHYIDTCTLIKLVKDYIRFDKSGVLQDKVRELFISDAWILVWSVYKEITHPNHPEVIKQLPFLCISKGYKKKLQFEKIYGGPIPDDWKVPSNFGKLEKRHRKEQIKKFQDSGDCQLILYALRIKRANRAISVVVTEETSISDYDDTKYRKPFKKIPDICDKEGIECISLPELLRKFGMQVNYKFE